jgi:hypothetical protein
MRKTTLLLTVLALCAGALGADDAVSVTQPNASHRHQSRGAELDAVAIPRLVSYQGKLTDTLGQPVADSTYGVSFKLYTVPSGGVSFWNETQNVTTRDGLFAVLLGAVTPIGSVPDAGTLYLGMAVSGGAELAPRLRIVSAAYAYKADTANYALASPGGGDNAWVRGTPDSVLYTVHRLGIARGGSDNMLHGNFRQSHVNFGVSCTTGVSGQNYSNATVSGGVGNAARAAWATVGGGSLNKATGSGSAVLGGAGNNASGIGACVVGGALNLASGDYSTVTGGQSDTALALCGAVLSGWLNRAGDAATDTCATVAGGIQNDARSPYATVGGGWANYAWGTVSTVAGGSHCGATEDGGAVGGGYWNLAGDHAAIAGGSNNTAFGLYAAIPGGQRNMANGTSSFAAGDWARALHNSCFVWSDSLVAFSDTLYTTGSNQWRVRARGGAWFYSNLAKTTGAYLAPGSNAWTSACDSATKEDFRPVDREALLDKVAALRVRDYKMKDQDDGTRHIGPVAQDFHSAFGYGETEKGINTADADGVLMAAVQALYEQNQALSRRVAELETKLSKE